MAVAEVTHDSGHDDEISLLDLLLLLRRGLVPAVLIAMAAGVGTYLVRGLSSPTYVAQATILTASQDPNQRDFGTTLVTAPPLDVATYRAAIASRPVIAAALAALKDEAPTEQEMNGLLGAVSVRSEGTAASSILRIQVRDLDPDRARDLANAVATAALTWDAQRATRTLESIIDSLQAQIASVDEELALASSSDALETTGVAGLERNRAELSLQLSSARALRSGAVGRLEMFEEAGVPSGPTGTGRVRYAALAAVVAAIMVYGWLLLRTATDTRLRGIDDLVGVAELPLMAEFPKVGGGRRQLPREAASYLRTSVSFATQHTRTKVVQVTSTGPGHGKSSVAISLAESLARQRYRVLLLDADLRMPVLGTEYGLDPASTFSVEQALQLSSKATPTRLSLQDGVTLDLLPGFETASNPTELLEAGFGALLARMGPHYDFIVVDSAPVLPVADSLVIAPQVTGVVFAVSLATAQRSQVVNALGLLRRMGANLLGVAATNLDLRQLGPAGYGYGFGYGAVTQRKDGLPGRRPQPPVQPKELRRHGKGLRDQPGVSAAPTSVPSTPIELFDSGEFPRSGGTDPRNPTRN